MSKILKSENIVYESLLPCPFCGTTSEELTSEGKKKCQLVILKKVIEEINSFGIDQQIETRFYVGCTKCGCQSGSGTTGYNGLTKHTITEEEAMNIAIQKWNNRK